jgi:hypothetical protein
MSAMPERAAPDWPLDARVIVDEEQGVAVSVGIIPGLVYPSFIDPASQSTFVPQDIAAGFERLPKQMRDPNPSDQDTGTPYTAVIRVEPATQAVAEVTKYYGNQIQGAQRYMQMQPGTESVYAAGEVAGGIVGAGGRAFV